jgi:hypothetical protein
MIMAGITCFVCVGDVCAKTADDPNGWAHSVKLEVRRDQTFQLANFRLYVSKTIQGVACHNMGKLLK